MGRVSDASARLLSYASERATRARPTSQGFSACLARYSNLRLDSAVLCLAAARTSTKQRCMHTDCFAIRFAPHLCCRQLHVDSAALKALPAALNRFPARVHVVCTLLPHRGAHGDGGWQGIRPRDVPEARLVPTRAVGARVVSCRVLAPVASVLGSHASVATPSASPIPIHIHLIMRSCLIE